MQKIDLMLDNIRRELKPESRPKELDPFLKKLNARLKKLKVQAKAVAGGSLAKNTYLKNDFDIDIFVLFGKKYDNLSDSLEKAVKPFKAQRLHGSRDYFLVKGKPSFEIVPVLKISRPLDAENITDVSPLHVEWVNKHLKGKQKLADDIRLAKQFCKGQLCYGAESFISGFSGHVIDILIIHHGGFINLLKAARKWKHPVVIDSERHHRGRAIFNLNKSKLGPLVVIDPLQPDRNAAAAVSLDQFTRFVEASDAFLERPDPSFFRPPELTLEPDYPYLIFEVIPKSDKHDVAGAQIINAHSRILMECQRLGFSIAQAVVSWKGRQASLFYVFEKAVLGDEVVIEGPFTKMKSHSERFKSLHQKSFVRNGRLYARVKRKVKNLVQLAKNLDRLGLENVKIRKGKNPKKSLCVRNLVKLHIFKYY